MDSLEALVLKKKIVKHVRFDKRKSSQEHLHARLSQGRSKKTESYGGQKARDCKTMLQENNLLLTMMKIIQSPFEMKEVNPYKRKHETLKAKTLKNYKAPK